MKKTLVAIAAIAAATGAMAQSSVQITGVLDAGYKNTTYSTNGANAAKTIFNNGVSTSQFDFIGTQDLGNGQKAGFFMELDVNPSYSSTLNQKNEGQTAFSGTPFTGQQIVTFTDARLGTIKIGSPDSAALNTGLTAQPFGTALGSGYSAAFGRLGTAAVSGISQYVGGPNSGGRIIRHEKTVKLESNAYYGVSASVEYAAKNANSATNTSNNNGYQALGLQYANGPLNVQYANVVAQGAGAAGTFQVTSAAIAAGGAAVAAGALTGATDNTMAAGQVAKYNLLGANYTVGATTVYAGYTTTFSNAVAGTAVEDSKSKNIGVKYVMGNVDLLGNYLKRTSNLTSQSDTTGSVGYNPTATLTGLGANYNFSKTVLAYYRFEKIAGLNTTSSTDANAVQKINAVGLVVKF